MRNESDANPIISAFSRTWIITQLKQKKMIFEDVPIVYKTRHQAVQYVCIITRGSSGNNACLLLSLL
ncbi:hypothetical protein [Psychrobacillus lasiicapitis]|uniref:Uncharacterized protein n=1 Tax=Psychrobacillus lasiicapitis TaxID=1636719 RepID=A0A544T364_9BACI|nr:hypothetical protein [Psychrobacillus lasiicapitis]TQR11878.1 hypothetical protein FG382_14800 [Psychrobacillus lasiicapitis]GGA20179.1 hypothetical protein GCM10011384_06930 [Psychrobacillus lasiicapitis]